MIIHYRKDLKSKAHQLRTHQTYGELTLWSRLRRRQLLNYKFIRQKPIQNYIVDFFCKELNLIIEVNGTSHDIKMDYDQNRQSELESLRLHVLNFTDYDCRRRTTDVLETIVMKIQEIENLR